MLSWTSLPSTPLQDIIGGVITRDSKRVLKPLNRHMTQIVSYSKPKEMVERAKIADQIYLLSHAMRNFLMYYTFQLHCWEWVLTRSLESFVFWSPESALLSKQDACEQFQEADWGVQNGYKSWHGRPGDKEVGQTDGTGELHNLLGWWSVCWKHQFFLRGVALRVQDESRWKSCRPMGLQYRQVSHQDHEYAKRVADTPGSLSNWGGTQAMDRCWLSLKRFIPASLNRKKKLEVSAGCIHTDHCCCINGRGAPMCCEERVHQSVLSCVKDICNSSNIVYCIYVWLYIYGVFVVNFQSHDWIHNNKHQKNKQTSHGPPEKSPNISSNSLVGWGCFVSSSARLGWSHFYWRAGFGWEPPGELNNSCYFMFNQVIQATWPNIGGHIYKSHGKMKVKKHFKP